MKQERARQYYTSVRDYHDIVEESRERQMFSLGLIRQYLAPSDIVVDVGGGTGANAELLGIDPNRYVCCDLSMNGLKLGQEKGRGAMLQSDSSSMSIKSNSADVVLCSWSFEHMSDPAKTLQEIVRITRPGGRVMIWGPNWDNIFRKDFPQLSHRSILARETVRWRIFLKMLRNEFLPFRYSPYITDDVAAFADPDRYVAHDYDAVHCVLCQETVKWFQQHGGRIVFLADFADMTLYIHNSRFIQAVRRLLKPLLPILRNVPLLRWFVIRFPLVVEIP